MPRSSLIIKPYILSTYVRKIRNLPHIIGTQENLTLNTKAEDEFEKIKVPIKLEKLQIQIIKEIELLKNIEQQDVTKFVDNFKNIIKIGNLDDEYSIELLNAIVETDIKKHIESGKTVENKLKLLHDLKYPKKNSLRYIKEIYEVKQIGFKSIREYMDDIIKKINNYCRRQATAPRPPAPPLFS